MAMSPTTVERNESTSVLVTESRPSDVLAALHQSAEADSEYLFAARDPSPDDLILVAWTGDTAVGYIATTDMREEGMLLWEHLVVPSHRSQGLGRRLLFEAARRAVQTAVIEVDPLGQLDLDRVADYYRSYGFHHDATAGRLTANAGDVVRNISRNHAAAESRATVAELLARKPGGVFTVRPSTSVRQAIESLNRERIGAVVVSEDDIHVSGILSERDVLLALTDGDLLFLDKTVAELDTTDVVTCTTNDPIGAAMDVMTRLRIRHLPVTEEGRLVGVISPGDVVKFRLEAIEAAGYLEQAGFFDD